MHQHRFRTYLVKQSLRCVFDRMPVGVECRDQIVFAQRGGAKMIFQRLRGNRALHTRAIHLGRKSDDEIARAILRMFLGK